MSMNLLTVFSTFRKRYGYSILYLLITAYFCFSISDQALYPYELALQYFFVALVVGGTMGYVRDIRRYGFMKASEKLSELPLYLLFGLPKLRMYTPIALLLERTGVTQWYKEREDRILFFFWRIILYGYAVYIGLERLRATNFGAGDIYVPNANEVFAGLLIAGCVITEIVLFILMKFWEKMDITVRMTAAFHR